MTSQRLLTKEQVAAFYHDEFVRDQIDDFRRLFGRDVPPGIVVDVGGGCGFFAAALAAEIGAELRVLDSDQRSVDSCDAIGVNAEQGDALRPALRGDEGLATFNLILHHLIDADESRTYAMQRQALEAWHSARLPVFVNEYIYESFVGMLSGRLIYEITRSRLLGRLLSLAGRLVPALRANTLGIGVRFRAHDEWRRLFASAGYRVEASTRGLAEPVSPLWRVLLIREIRRDSFRLVPA